jgi:transketolase
MRKEFAKHLHDEMSFNEDIILLTGDLEGKIPVVYSITPFVLYRPFEWIRNYLNHECTPVKLVGGGRDKDYGYLGFSHWGEEDIKVMSIFKNIQLIKPKTINSKTLKTFLYSEKPTYINLKR